MPIEQSGRWRGQPRSMLQLQPRLLLLLPAAVAGGPLNIILTTTMLGTLPPLARPVLPARRFSSSTDMLSMAALRCPHISHLRPSALAIPTPASASSVTWDRLFHPRCRPSPPPLLLRRPPYHCLPRYLDCNPLLPLPLRCRHNSLIRLLICRHACRLPVARPQIQPFLALSAW